MKLTPEEVCADRRFAHGPAWRRVFAQALVSSPSSKWRAMAAHHVLEARNYLRGRAQNPQLEGGTGHRFEQVVAALRLANDSATCAQLKVLVLGGCPSSEIAA